MRNWLMPRLTAYVSESLSAVTATPSGEWITRQMTNVAMAKISAAT